MRLSDIPDSALTASATPLPTKTVVMYDWDALHQTLVAQGFVIIDSDDVRITPAGMEESIPVKAFNTHMRVVKKLRLRTRRISAHRWYCTL